MIEPTIFKIFEARREEAKRLIERCVKSGLTQAELQMLENQIVALVSKSDDDRREKCSMIADTEAGLAFAAWKAAEARKDESEKRYWMGQQTVSKTIATKIRVAA